MKQRMLILSGLPASGKSTFANDLMDREYDQWGYINWDMLRHTTPNWKWSKENERKIQEQSYNLARVYALQGRNLIVDNTNLSDASIGKWTRLASELNMDVETRIFVTPVEECVRRDALRTGTAHVGRVVIERMALANGLIHFPKDRKIVIVDVDGTLANSRHRIRQKQKQCQPCKGLGKVNYIDLFTGNYLCKTCMGSGYVLGTDWDYFFRPELIEADPPFMFTVDWVRELYKDHTVLIVSGRAENQAAKSTVNWLQKNEIPYHHIFMRNSGDKRDDTIVKQEILDKILDIVPKSMIAFTVDDRSRVVSMWRQNGLKCFQVVSPEEGDF